MLAIMLLFMLTASHRTTAIQSNQTCVPTPDDKRQIVCQCSRSLQLRCLYNPEILLMSVAHLDRSLRPVFYDDVHLDRHPDPDDSSDPSADFAANRAKFAASTAKFYIYFPNFEIMSSPYVRITLSKFVYVPSLAFVSRLAGSQRRKIESIVFELANSYDFGIDEYALSRVDVTETLLFEGPFNQMNVHTNAFSNSVINELIFGCYCVECEYFVGECRLNFNQSSKPLAGVNRRGNGNKSTRSGVTSEDNNLPQIKSIKLYGVDFNLNVDQIPGIKSLSRLEITNLKSKTTTGIEFRSAGVYPNLTDFVFKNNNLNQLNSLNVFYIFTGLKSASFAQNLISRLEKDAFKFATLKSLEELNLERNKISRIDRNVFASNLVNLKVLNLNQNNIESIEDRAFSYLEKLETLDLTRNKLNYLNENTFYGLRRLQTLLLSYNPFKSFEPNTFKNVGGSLTRLDIISNSESDWFTFDDSDVCLLSFFKCNVQIYIDADQRCNCFVKYLNYIGSSGEGMVSDASSVWFKPCQFSDSPYSNLNKYFDEMSSYYEDIEANSQLGVHGPPPRKQLDDSNSSPKTNCPKQPFQNCFSSPSMSPFMNQSCLYRRFVLNEEPKTPTPGGPTTSTVLLRQYAQNESPSSSKTDSGDPASIKSPNKFAREAAESDGAKSSLVWKKYSVEESLTAITIGIAVVFLLSIVSLFIGIYLIHKRKTFVYHAANDSSYPHDER